MRFALLCGTLLTTLTVGLFGARQVCGQALVLLVVAVRNPEILTLTLLIVLLLVAWYQRKTG